MDNSFSYVTRRKLHRSTNSLDNTFTEDNESLAHSGNYASLPDIENQCSLDMMQLLEYKTKVNELNIELMSAHEEIENLNRENRLLKDKLDDTKKTLEKFKSILHSDNIMTPSTIKKKKNKLNRSNIGLPGPDIQRTKQDDIKDNKIKEPKYKKNPMTDYTTQTTNATTQEKKLPKISSITKFGRHVVLPSRKIMILGDQQAVDLSIILHNMRISAKKYNLPAHYEISSTVFPNATTEHITRNAKIINEELNDNDWVILSVGSNDQNPIKFNIDLSYALKCLTKPNVLIISVLKNRYLNEIKLNNMTKTISKNFKNCHYLDLFALSNSSIISKYNISSMINFYINNYDYKYYYIDNCIKIVNANRHTKQIKKHIRGTIPYYFKKPLQIKENNTIFKISEPTIKKGTIPYYFKKENDLFFLQRNNQ